MRILFRNELNNTFITSTVTDAVFDSREKALILFSEDSSFIVPNTTAKESNKLVRKLFDEEKLDLSDRTVIGPIPFDFGEYDEDEGEFDFDFDDDFDEDFDEDFEDLPFGPSGNPTVTKKGSKKNAQAIPFATKPSKGKKGS